MGKDINKQSTQSVRDSILDIIKSEYEKKGHLNVSTANVECNIPNVISVWINTEDPFLGNEFFVFLKEVQDKIEELLKSHGYVHGKLTYFYDFCIISYEFKKE